MKKALYLTSWEINDFRGKFTEMFKAIRKRGVVLARQNFKCCSTCACSAFSTEVEQLKLGDHAKFDKLKGLVYTHNQDCDDFKLGEVYVRFMSAHDSTVVEHELAESIVAAAKQVGLTAVWDGDVTKCVEVHYGE